MSIGKLAFAGFALVVLALVSGCDGWTEEIALEALQTEPSFDRSDPVIKAVTEADNTVKKIKEADSLLEVGLTTHELAPLREAAKLRPKDPTYAFYLDAMELALGLDSSRAEGRKLADEAIQSAHDPRFRTARQNNKAFVAALIETRSHFPDGSAEQKRLRNTYCVTIAEYQRIYEEPLETPKLDCDGIR